MGDMETNNNNERETMEHLYKIQPEETKAYRNYLDIEEWVEELNALDELDAINS